MCRISILECSSTVRLCSHSHVSHSGIRGRKSGGSMRRRSATRTMAYRNQNLKRKVRKTVDARIIQNKAPDNHCHLESSAKILMCLSIADDWSDFFIPKGSMNPIPDPLGLHRLKDICCSLPLGPDLADVTKPRLKIQLHRGGELVDACVKRTVTLIAVWLSHNFWYYSIRCPLNPSPWSFFMEPAS